LRENVEQQRARGGDLIGSRYENMFWNQHLCFVLHRYLSRANDELDEKCNVSISLQAKRKRIKSAQTACGLHIGDVSYLPG